MATPTAALDWTPFECDGHRFEYQAMPTRYKTRPAGWPAYKPAPGAWIPRVMVVVRKLGNKTGPAMLYPGGTTITTEHAVETARLFWAHLTR